MKPPPVTHVYIGACRRDFHLTRICVASVRYWHPDIPISLLVDDNLGKFDTSGLEHDWNVRRFEMPVKKFGIGFSKLELMFRPGRERYLVIDSDTVLTGPMLRRFNDTPGDFVVHPEYSRRDDLQLAVFDPELLAKFDPAFGTNRLAFNAGHYVGTSGLLRREDFDGVVDWTAPRRLRRPDIFKCGDQGVTNYVLQKAEKEGRLAIGELIYHLYVWRDTSVVTVEGLAARNSPPFIMHWAGINPPAIEGADREDVLRFFHDSYLAHSGEKSRRIDRREKRSPRALAEKVRGAFSRAASWLGAKPAVWGGEACQLAEWYQHHFHFPERRELATWVWTEPEAGIDLQVGCHDALVRMEIGSPFPMRPDGRNLRLFINGKEIGARRLEIADGVIELELRARELRPKAPQRLSWSIDRLESPGDKRRLGLPIYGIWVIRPRGLPGLSRMGLKFWMRSAIRGRQRDREALRA